MNLKDFIIVCGHYGCGKTNFAINLAIDYKNRGRDVTLADLDLVNPYFRVSDYKELVESRGIHVVTPSFGATNLDIPSLSPEIYSIFENHDLVIIDAGGDDVGATVLGRFHEKLKGINYDMLYLVNRYRSLTTSPEEAVQVLREIEAVSRLRATQIVNNSHLKQETTSLIINEALEFGRTAALLTDLPLLLTTVPAEIADSVEYDEEQYGKLYPVDIYVKTNWEL